MARAEKSAKSGEIWQFPENIRGVIVGGAPLNRDTFRSTISGTRPQLEAWAELAGGQVPLDEVIQRLLVSTIETAGETTTMAVVWGEDHPVFAWLAENLYDNAPGALPGAASPE
jgi:hypothetical protein